MLAAEIEERVARVVRETVPESNDLRGEFVLLGAEGVVDSVTALQLMLALEKEFGIVIQDADVQPDNLRNLDRIVRFVQAALARR